MTGRDKKKGLGANLLLLAVVLFICLIAAEVVLRFTWKGFRPHRSTQTLSYDDTLGWVGKINSETLLSEGGIKVPCRINNWGFRDYRSYPIDKTSGKHRLLILGDSFVMGTGIAEEARVSQQLEAQDSSIIAYNFGIMGYSTDQELLVLKKYGPQVQPDDIFLFFCANDLIYNDSDFGHKIPKPHFRLNADGSLNLGNVPVPNLINKNPVLMWLQNNSALVQITSKITAQLSFQNKLKRQRHTAGDLGLERGERGKADLDSLLLFSSEKKTSDLTYHLLKEVKAETDRLGARFILFTAPSNQHWTATRNETPEEIGRVLNWCEELNIEAVDLFPVFYQNFNEYGEKLYLPDKMHWNERGNRIAAEAIYHLLGNFQ
ncbi:hypothetical protein CEE37_01625 [candidate division LCP-89 bacterium B3_LCP]|uniref:SGNH hydrolase-type esterase domain-containing protein n=1 Tax=candidate division LCP-89 bacterium B3_LCP TaxID=2012998 RepID=A0A532V5E8_UNCL8|nr:MAG: hypothetical protein CEE37_01625 [candidate division LCP-89 bacterium B3_LCP]